MDWHKVSANGVQCNGTFNTENTITKMHFSNRRNKQQNKASNIPHRVPVSQSLVSNAKRQSVAE